MIGAIALTVVTFGILVMVLEARGMKATRRFRIKTVSIRAYLRAFRPVI